MTPSFRSIGAEASEATSGAYENEQVVQEAFRQGVEYAIHQYQLHQEEQAAGARQQQVEGLADDNTRREQALAASIEALHKREYRAPIQPMACKDEREAVLKCYRTNEKSASGDLVFACEKDVRNLEECASIIRMAAVAKIVPGSLGAA